jgi:hypothetical protein
MTASILMIIGVCQFLAAASVGFVNSIVMIKSGRSWGDNPWFFVIHFICSILASIGGLMLVGGFIWFLVQWGVDRSRQPLQPEKPAAEQVLDKGR